MDQLAIITSADDPAIIKRMKKSLLKNFKLTRSNDLDKAVILANFLFAIGNIIESKELLESFVFKQKYNDEREDLWGSNGQGIVLLAHICGELGDPKRRKDTISIIQEIDFVTYQRSRFQTYKEALEEHESSMEYAYTETHKYMC